MKLISTLLTLALLSVVTLFRQLPVWWKIGRGRRGISSSNVFLP
jgi:hypothetical protein